MFIDLFQFIKNAISKCGTYAILNNLWTPTNEQLDQPFINRMKIKASIAEAESGKTITFSRKELEELVDS